MPLPETKRPRARLRVDADRPLPARQDRSRLTAERLLNAAQALVCEGGAEAATLRAIASRAGVSVAIVYRRFPDKDAVLRALYTRFFAAVASANAEVLSEQLRHPSLEQVAAALVAGIAKGYRRHRLLVRGLVLYARTHHDAEFRRRAESLNREAVTGIRRTLDRHRARISHPEPDVALPFAVAAVASVLADRIVFSDVGHLPRLSERQVVEEATRMFLAYLGVATPAGDSLGDGATATSARVARSLPTG